MKIDSIIHSGLGGIRRRDRYYLLSTRRVGSSPTDRTIEGALGKYGTSYRVPTLLNFFDYKVLTYTHISRMIVAMTILLQGINVSSYIFTVNMRCVLT